MTIQSNLRRVFLMQGKEMKTMNDLERPGHGWVGCCTVLFNKLYLNHAVGLLACRTLIFVISLWIECSRLWHHWTAPAGKSLTLSHYWLYQSLSHVRFLLSPPGMFLDPANNVTADDDGGNVTINAANVFIRREVRQWRLENAICITENYNFISVVKKTNSSSRLLWLAEVELI